jgi:CheY-like chemotaxis protein
VGNAVKYTEEGSVVVRANASAIEHSQSLTLVLEVEDTGIGIAPEDWARIFDAFIQVGAKRTRQGTGLGLAISRSFVQLLGGTVQVESAVGSGSRFRVEVPVEIAEASEVAPMSAVPQIVGLQPGQPDYRVLIVEDHRDNWLLLQRLLQTAGFEVRVVENSADAVETFEKWRPHFIWMDLRLPGQSGVEAAKRIRSHDSGKDVKIVAVTASAFATQRDDVLAAGLDDFLRKPYRPAEIFDCMARHLGVRYIYREHQPESGAAQPVTVRPEDLATLPNELLDELENAIISLDQVRVALVVREITGHSDRIGSALSLLTNQFAYTPILNLLKSGGRFTGASA